MRSQIAMSTSSERSQWNLSFGESFFQTLDKDLPKQWCDSLKVTKTKKDHRILPGYNMGFPNPGHKKHLRLSVKLYKMVQR